MAASRSRGSLDWRSIFRALHEQGFVVEQTSRGHYRVYAPDPTKQVVHISLSEEPRAIRNAVLQLRKSGFSWRGERDPVAPKRKKEAMTARSRGLRKSFYVLDTEGHLVQLSPTLAGANRMAASLRAREPDETFYVANEAQMLQRATHARDIDRRPHVHRLGHGFVALTLGPRWDLRDIAGTSIARGVAPTPRDTEREVKNALHRYMELSGPERDPARAGFFRRLTAPSIHLEPGRRGWKVIVGESLAPPSPQREFATEADALRWAQSYAHENGGKIYPYSVDRDPARPRGGRKRPASKQRRGASGTRKYIRTAVVRWEPGWTKPGTFDAIDKQSVKDALKDFRAWARENSERRVGSFTYSEASPPSPEEYRQMAWASVGQNRAPTQTAAKKPWYAFVTEGLRDPARPRPTAKQRAFIAAKIPVLVDEGYPQRQAIAIAYRMAGVPPLEESDLDELERPRKATGFALMSPDERRALAMRGGQASYASGRGHRFDSENASASGRKGGQRSRGGGRPKGSKDTRPRTIARDPSDDLVQIFYAHDDDVLAYVGGYEIKITLRPDSVSYLCYVTHIDDDRVLWRGIVRAPASGYGRGVAYDSYEAYVSVAKAARSFAEDAEQRGEPQLKYVRGEMQGLRTPSRAQLTVLRGGKRDPARERLIQISPQYSAADIRKSTRGEEHGGPIAWDVTIGDIGIDGRESVIASGLATEEEAFERAYRYARTHGGKVYERRTYGRDPARLTTRQRRQIPARLFALPERRALPIEDPAHIRNAAARLEQMRRRGTVTAAEYRSAKARILRAERANGITPRARKAR